MHYQSELSPETEIVYPEVSVYRWRTKVNTIDLGKNGVISYLVSEGQVIQPPTTILEKLTVKEVHMLFIFLTAISR
jgi:hypothetical protein